MFVVNQLLKLSELQPGQNAVIDSFTDSVMELKLLEMGCTPGETIRLERIAPFGDPIAIKVAGYVLSLRKQEASSVLVHLLPNS
jgi:ferrous iron transport protein A